MPTTTDNPAAESAPSLGSETVDWPTDEGIWMAKFESIGWFPIRSMYLRDDLPTLEEIARKAAGEVMPPRKVLAIVAQFPESATSWPYTFKGCHPVKEWRRPNADEMDKARKYYGESPNNPLVGAVAAPDEDRVQH